MMVLFQSPTRTQLVIILIFPTIDEELYQMLDYGYFAIEDVNLSILIPYPLSHFAGVVSRI